ncbi:MAG: A/G-specific adenine glycosylase [Clostridia bacterium]
MTLRHALLSWHDTYARDLPWRGEHDPYRIWVSEIMLQQTRAETVVPYYHAFLREFPTLDALARADDTRVLKQWEGLGYYSRARNLHRGAQLIVDELGGRFPETVPELLKLPGVGKYTSGAIASMAFGLAEPAIDGNQVRVLARLFDMRLLTTLPAAKAQLAAHARALIDPDRPGDFNQALMGLGALLCVPRKPDCAKCPSQAQCLAFAAGVQGTLPVLPEKVKQRVERRAVALVFAGARVYVRRRADSGLLGGLWEFPNFLDARSDADVRAALAEMGLIVTRHAPGPRAKHVFTHLIWHMTGHLYEAAQALNAPQFSDGQALSAAQFADAKTLSALPMPTALKPFRDAALARIAP